MASPTREIRVNEMTIELIELPRCPEQHESLLRARWGRDFSREVFRRACDRVYEHDWAEAEDDAWNDEVDYGDD